MDVGRAIAIRLTRGERRNAFDARMRDELRQALAQAGVDTLELSTDGDLVDAIVRFTQLRKRRSQLSSGAGLPAHLSSARKAA